MDWAEKFTSKLKAKELARQEDKKNFKIYQSFAQKLFSNIESKMKQIEAISIMRHMVGQSETTPIQLKALKLKCYEKYLEFIPEGINLDNSKGTIRIKHNTRHLPQFTYLHLTIDPEAEESYPDNLIWVINKESRKNYVELPKFDDVELEKLVEKAFLG